MNLVCLDCQLFSWGVLGRASKGQEDKIPRAQFLIKHLDETRAAIVIPTPVVTELLMGADPSERANILHVLEERFYVREFDQMAAIHSADVWNKKRKDGVEARIRQHAIEVIPGEGNGWMRSTLKVDIMILGCAIAANVSAFYTNDNNLKKWADGFLPVRGLPEIPEQSPMLLNFPNVLQPPSAQSPDAAQP